MSGLSGVEQRFLDFILSKEGCLYCWPTEANRYSGKDLSYAKYQNVYDCSGLVTAGLYHATGGKVDWRAQGNCQSLWDKLQEAPGPGALRLVFYGIPAKLTRGRGDHANHVMVCMEDGRVYGARGGNATTTSPEVAKYRNANVRYARSPEYRKDILGYRFLFPLPEQT